MANKPEQIFLLNADTTQSTDILDKSPSDALDNLEDFSNVCRICATVTECIVPIFEGEGLQHELADKIATHLPIKVSEQDRLPHGLCYGCMNTLLAWHELTVCCSKTDSVLRSHPLVTQVNGVVLNPGSNDLSPKESPAASDASADDEPLAAVAARRAADTYAAFYEALLRFRNHFVEEHESGGASASDGDSELAAADEVDDLSACELRRGRLSAAARAELAAARVQVDGRAYYECAACGKRLGSAHTFACHRRIHSGERPCVCHECGKQFRAPAGLHRHLAETHARRRPHACAPCGRAFASAQTLRQHARTHTGERPYECARCGRRFAQSGSLHAHARTHSSARPHRCAPCGARFRLRAGLARHALRHSGARPHACALCAAAFRQRHELRAHLLAHEGARPHACARCPAAFRLRRALRTHERRLHAAPAPTAAMPADPPAAPPAAPLAAPPPPFYPHDNHY